MFKRDLVLAQEYLGFLLLNLFDLFLTGLIFKNQGQEGNVVAKFVLLHFKLQGFAIFKFLMVVFIVLICEVISLKNIRTARMLVVGASLLYLVVVLYECFGIWMFIERPQMAPKETISVVVNGFRDVVPAWIYGTVQSFGALFSIGGVN